MRPDPPTRGAARRSVLVVVALAATLTATSPGSPVAADGNEAPGAPAPFRSLTVGNRFACAVIAGGKLKCWGYNDSGQLGQGDMITRGDGGHEMGADLATVDLGSGRTVTTVTAGSAHACAILDDGTVKCWGDNEGGGALGQGDQNRSNHGASAGDMGDNLPALDLGTGRSAAAITTGNGHSCVVLDSGVVKCWGNNLQGQLGLGDTATRGDGPGEMGDNLPAVGLGTGRTATTVAAGAEHTCAILDNATVKCWGNNGSGRLGLGSTNNRGDGANEMGDNLPTVNLGTGRTATAVAAGGGHTCALLDNGQVKCWGTNSTGQLGVGDTNSRGDGANEMGDSLPTVNLGTGRTATAVTAGGAFTCALLDNGQVKCWGANEYGELGLGDTSPRGDNAGEMGDNLPTVDLGTGRTATAVSAGNYSVCASLDDGSLKCWGYNGEGRLGLGDVANRGDNPGEMGDNLPAVALTGTGIAGSVADTTSGADVTTALVAVLRSSDFTIAGGDEVNGNGDYAIALPAGTYHLYLLDRTGAHRAGFHGPPAVVPVTTGQVTTVTTTMAPGRGAISGTVTGAESGNPISHAQLLAVRTNTGAITAGTRADSAGHYSFTALPVGTYFVVLLDPAADHRTTFFPAAPDVTGATPVAVTAGGTTTADASLPAQAPTSAGAALSGRVTDARSGANLEGMVVIALTAGDLRLARVTLTSGSGLYTLNVAPGDYKVGFLDPTGLHAMEWFDDQPASAVGQATTVTAPANSNAALTPLTGTVQGTVTRASNGAFLDSVWIVAIGPTGVQSVAITNPFGGYSLALPLGTYRAAIVDARRGAQVYWEGSADYFGAAVFAISAGDTTMINSTLDV